MSASELFRTGEEPGPAVETAPGSLLDVLRVATVVLDSRGRIVLWSPQAEELFGYTAAEALGRYAARLMVDERHLDVVLRLFERVMTGDESEARWAGVFPVRHKDGAIRFVEFRNMRLMGEDGGLYALGLATDSATLRQVETELALSVQLINQSPIGLGVFDTELRYVSVNPALERINGLPAAEHIGRHISETVSFLETGPIEAAMRQVLHSGVPVLDQYAVGRPPAPADEERAWSVSHYRLEDAAGRVLGVASSVVDVTERHRAATEAAEVRHRLALIAEASIRVGTTLDLDQTARELAELCVPGLADIAAVDVLDSVLAEGRRAAEPPVGPAAFRALALAGDDGDVAMRAADPVGEVARYETDRLVTRCVSTLRPILLAEVRPPDLPRIAAHPRGAELLARAGLRSYLAVPLIARGEVLGALDLKRTRNPAPFDEDDVVLARELAARAAVCIDNARWYQTQRHAALSLQRTLLPGRPPERLGLRIAYRYQPARADNEVGGDWFDVIALDGDKTALVVGDVMGSGIHAAATMGQLRTAGRALANLDLDPARVLHCVDATATGLEQDIATCVYAVYDPHRAECRISVAGHLPPVLIHPDRPPELLDLPPGAPLGVGGVPFRTSAVPVSPGDQLLLYTDGLVEKRDEPIDVRLRAMLSLLTGARSPEENCSLLLEALPDPGHHDDVAMLIARFEPPE
ncbi:MULTISPECIES: SpoIIE family protein phosphatase [Streptomycetaceae]|uniref:protein-serine/threonine phosphatase n=1 Tax=Streptantibioticus cattleyicolor (strain ATCC 35852 / DSM 46488 / JCM 4925 / NBRC 14057 / NRRL 8057) TaxID=1003195 RepID=F8JNR6_STREN|nr:MULTISPECIES: SpoIIE family protein phosphatase [Streptomycetaceae]AEW92645.1 putative magnesium or manganese-dependent protein phosphatase [Streptantibioticus cattleyicolor NRRL 8057 = DSM 46488]MYS57422.1 SpoIIE family protein phosphatase [Streptomyces sp. SID5468]CCB73001.1 putative magnesium or manganese-dependent protein phosphatase [Streptantibioticus cattleyicolor NRRL 8057 = DSM 46488]